MKDIKAIIRANIHEMEAYSSARSEFKGGASVWLDANESPYPSKFNRYPDPLQTDLKKRLADLKGLNTNQLFLGNGSDEAIDLLFRAFCEPGMDKAYLFPPTYGMYMVCAQLNNVEVVEMEVKEDFSLPSLQDIRPKLNTGGLLFICSPNNPTGNCIEQRIIREIAQTFSGIVVVDEAYIDFSETGSMLDHVSEIPNLVVLQTLSKAWGMAGLRIGMAFANSEIIEVLNKIKPPYNINTLSQTTALNMLDYKEETRKRIHLIKEERKRLKHLLETLPIVQRIYPSNANFLLIEFLDPGIVFKNLVTAGIVVRNRTHQIKGCLRVSVGTPQENEKVLNVLRKMK